MIREDDVIQQSDPALWKCCEAEFACLARESRYIASKQDLIERLRERVQARQVKRGVRGCGYVHSVRLPLVMERGKRDRFDRERTENVPAWAYLVIAGRGRGLWKDRISV